MTMTMMMNMEVSESSRNEKQNKNKSIKMYKSFQVLQFVKIREFSKIFKIRKPHSRTTNICREGKSFGLPYSIPFNSIKPTLSNAETLRDGDILLFGCLSVCLSVRLSPWSLNDSPRGWTCRWAGAFRIVSDTRVQMSVGFGLIFAFCVSFSTTAGFWVKVSFFLCI